MLVLSCCCCCCALHTALSGVLINPLKRPLNNCSGSLNQCLLLFYTSYKRETFCVRSHTVKSIWKCRPTVGRHFDVGFINQALLAKVSLLDNSPFCGTVKPQSRPGNPTDKMKKMSIMANPIMSGGSLVFLTTAHNRAMSSHVQNRLSTDTCETHRYERMGMHTWFKV